MLPISRVLPQPISKNNLLPLGCIGEVYTDAMFQGNLHIKERSNFYLASITTPLQYKTHKRKERRINRNKI